MPMAGPIDQYQRQRETDDDENVVWDSVRFPQSFDLCHDHSAGR